MRAATSCSEFHANWPFSCVPGNGRRGLDESRLITGNLDASSGTIDFQHYQSHQLKQDRAHRVLQRQIETDSRLHKTRQSAAVRLRWRAPPRPTPSERKAAQATCVECSVFRKEERQKNHKYHRAVHDHRGALEAAAAVRERLKTGRSAVTGDTLQASKAGRRADSHWQRTQNTRPPPGIDHTHPPWHIKRGHAYGPCPPTPDWQTTARRCLTHISVADKHGQ